MERAFVARNCNTTLTGHSFTEIGDQLIVKGFDMARAEQKPDGILVVPHAKSARVWAKVYSKVAPVDPVVIDVQPEVAKAVEAGERVAKQMSAVGIYTRDCGAVHPEGVVCIIPVFAERACCSEVIYPHDGPHEVTNEHGVVTHRWIEERVVTDLPFNGYGEYVDNEEQIG